MLHRDSLRNLFTGAATLIAALSCAAGSAHAQNASVTGCAGLPNYAKLKAALIQATKDETSGLNNHMWATIVDRDGVVCAVAFSGKDRFSQWPGSRVISAQKANTANAFGLDSGSSSDGSGQKDGLALSTANLFSAVQPGGSLYGLQFSNPVNEDAGYKIPSSAYGTAADPMKGGKIGGVNVFGGGLALFAAGKKMVGGIGVSGDTSCADHFIAWRLRNNLGLDHLAGVGGISGDPQRPDNIVFDITNGQSKGGFGHPSCINTGNEKMLPAVQP
jgi:uncharacterized protein GlcG (DUF336 family)